MSLKRDRKYPLLSARTVVLLTVVTICIVSILVFVFDKKSIFNELEITVSIISVGLFLFLTIGLFKGVRLKNEPVSLKWKWNPFSSEHKQRGSKNFKDSAPKNVGEILDCVDCCPLDFVSPFEAVDSLEAFIVWLLVTIVAIVLIFILANLVWGVVILLTIFVYWVFYRALRQVFIKSRLCKGKVMPSIAYGFLYTLLYTSWIYGVIIIGKIVMK